jgi:lysophospholipase L1-like esterase
MQRYVDEGRAAGIKVVLVTPLSRRKWNKEGKINSALQPYADVVKTIAADSQVPLIDLHTRSIELYEKLGEEGVLAISPNKRPSTRPGNGDDAAPATTQKSVPDGTHLNAAGGKMVGTIVAQELAKSVPDLAPYVKPKASE